MRKELFSDKEAAVARRKISCDYCGAIIDILTDDVCPNCGAPFGKSKHIKELQDSYRRMRNMELEMKEAELERIRLDNSRKRRSVTYGEKAKKNQRRIVRITLFTIIALIVISVLIPAIALTAATKEYMRDEWEGAVEATEEPIIEDPVTVSFNEAAELNNYSVICDAAEEYYYPWDKADDGYYYIKLHLIVANKSDKDLYVPAENEIICSYNKNGYDVSAEINVISADHLSTRIYRNLAQPGYSTEGWVYFEVPLGAELKLAYDELVTIKISPENVVMLEN